MNCWPPKTSVKLYWQVSACPCGAFSATHTYRLQAANVSKKKTAKPVAKIGVRTSPRMLEHAHNHPTSFRVLPHFASAPRNDTFLNRSIDRAFQFGGCPR